MSHAQYQRLLQDALVHHRAGRLDQAEALYRRVRAALPNHFDAVHLSGIVALQRGRAAEAVELLSKAHRLGPKNAPCALRLGFALTAAGRAADAEQPFRTAVALDPASAEAWDGLAHCLKLSDRLSAAIECHQKALTLQSSFPKGLYNFGLTLSLAGRQSEALSCHERAIAIDPTYAKAYYGRAQVLQQMHRIPEAIAAYDKFLELEPGNLEARSYRLYALNHLDDLPREQLFAEHVAYGKAVGRHPTPVFANDPSPSRRLRLAILSPDLRAHSCAWFLEPLLRHLDPTQFELYLYHDHFRVDAVSEKLRGFASVWRNFVGQSDAAVEKAIRSDAPDILVDLAGHTGMTSRLPLFARHLAPVQVNYLGYPNTTGLSAMHYRFTDAIVDPVGPADALATEKLVRFAPTAWAYQPPPVTPEVNVRNTNIPTGAPDDGSQPNVRNTNIGPVTFGSFNNVAKVTDATLALWARVLAAVPGSRLLLKGRGFGDEAVRQRYFERFAAAGLPVQRIEFLERTAKTDDHLALYGRVDISLDTFPYHGTTTTCEALWMGVPVVTLMGDRHVARVSGSLLTAIGRGEWVAQTPEDYLRIATELAADPLKLAAIRAGLREEVRNSPLGDHAGQSARFAAALRECWMAWCASQNSTRAVA
ncbi:tetratricopeptide repeat protein [Oleiharenicola lentus]|uniref:protein O-GlcNAc transferase n=1 Tax=Oleiharenicola lentus TaxID=2508720 RepID=A0A4Q1C3T6_9BACT|nr:tetratricopeptide repeat protein [Oleiharenicola lentus]RXK53027.1 tetratricopeptide repeat protein [Oleiharenicola lentus]